MKYKSNEYVRMDVLQVHFAIKAKEEIDQHTLNVLSELLDEINDSPLKEIK